MIKLPTRAFYASVIAGLYSYSLHPRPLWWAYLAGGQGALHSGGTFHADYRRPQPERGPVLLGPCRPLHSTGGIAAARLRVGGAGKLAGADGTSGEPPAQRLGVTGLPHLGVGAATTGRR